MPLIRLRLQNLRCLPSAELQLHPEVNLITGANGAGKTSLLEAIYLLGRGRSFRTASATPLLQRGEAEFWVTGLLGEADVALAADRSQASSGVASGLSLATRIDVLYRRAAGLQNRINGQVVDSRARLAEAFAVQIIDPGIHRLVEEGPTERRRWLDWTVFHVEPQFVRYWQRCARALRQRRAALESGGDPGPWEAELAQSGARISVARSRVVEQLQPLWSALLDTLALPAVTLSFERGWPVGEDLAELLFRQRALDRSNGRTANGPHRSRVRLDWQGRPARESVSRGQQKLLGAALTLSAVQFVARQIGTPPTLLLDDPAAELDPKHAGALLDAVRTLGGQQVVTALRANDWTERANRTFHVERQAVKPLY